VEEQQGSLVIVVVVVVDGLIIRITEPLKVASHVRSNDSATVSTTVATYCTTSHNTFLISCQFICIPFFQTTGRLETEPEMLFKSRSIAVIAAVVVVDAVTVTVKSYTNCIIL